MPTAEIIRVSEMRCLWNSFRTKRISRLRVPGSYLPSSKKTLEANCVRHNVGLTLPSFLEIASIIDATDYLVILSENLASELADAEVIQVLDLPF